MRNELRRFIMNYIKNSDRDFYEDLTVDKIIGILCKYDDCSDIPYANFEDLIREIEHNGFINFNVSWLDGGYSDSEDQVYIYINNIKIILNIGFPEPDNLEEFIDYIIDTNKEAKKIKRKLEKVL